MALAILVVYLVIMLILLLTVLAALLLALPVPMDQLLHVSVAYLDTISLVLLAMLFVLQVIFQTQQYVHFA